MPQASRTGARGTPSEKDAVAKAQEQEFKRARGAISCAECRRLKLKCDKAVPCGSCKRRGCESICPNGALRTGQGTRFILADTDRLHSKISEMSDRIRQLEDALALMQAATTREVHPLLRPDLLKIKSSLELHSAINQASAPADHRTDQDMDNESQDIDAFGTLAVREDGAATFYGRSAGSESLLLDEGPAPEAEPGSSLDMDIFHPEIEALANAFPTAATGPANTANSHDMIIEHLPEWPRASRLCDLYLEQAPWFFGAITRRQLMEELLPLFYGEAIRSPEAASASPHSSQSPDSDGSPAPTLMVSSSAFARPANSTEASAHDLALIFVVFCFGALTDPDLRPAPNNLEASKYYQLTRAALNLEPVLDRPPSIATVQTLSLMGIYQGLVSDERSIESTWALMGLACKLAQSIGLHRDCARWRLPPSEVQKRRALFWELFTTDCWQALATGRLPSFALQYVDTELPADPDETLSDDGLPQPSFPAWKALWGKECVASVVEVTLTSRAPKYSLILELDRKIRDMELPNYAIGDPPKDASFAETMQHFMSINYRELTLLYVHRCFFAQALADYPRDPLRSQYAPSFLAGYRSACALITALRGQFQIYPMRIARFWTVWTHAFSSVVMLASVVTHGGNTKTAQAALSELRLAANLFEQAAQHGGRAVKFLPIVRRLHHKAHEAYGEGYRKPLPDIFSPRDPAQEGHNELSIFSGRTRTVATKTPKPALSGRHRSVSRRRPGPSAHSPSAMNVESASSPTSSGSGAASSRVSQSPTVPTPPNAMPDQDIPSLVSYANFVHPVLVDDMRSFDGHLDSEIYHAQQEIQMAQDAPNEPRSVIAGPSGYARTPSDSYYQQPTQYEHQQNPDWGHNYRQVPASVSTQAQPETYYHRDHHAPSPTVHYPPQFSTHDHAYHSPVYGSGDSTPSNGSTGQHYGSAPLAHPRVSDQEHSAIPPHPRDPYWNASSTHTQFPPPPGPPPAEATMYYAHQQAQAPSQGEPSQGIGYSTYGHYTSSHQASMSDAAPSSHAAAHSHPPVLPVHSDRHSLPEMWTSFMQHAVPPTQQRYSGERR